MSEAHTNLVRTLRKAAAPGTILFPYANGLYKTLQGNPITLGVPGVLDLIGYTMMTVTQEMVGKSLPIFTAIDAKVGKDITRQTQKDFIAAITAAGGIIGVAKSIEDLQIILKKRLD